MAAIELYSTPLINDANLVGYWRMEGNSNYTQAGSDGTDTGMSYSSSYGKFGQGPIFSSTSTRIRLPYNANYMAFGSGAFSVSAWLYPTTLSGDSRQWIGNQDNGDHVTMWGLYLYKDNSFKPAFYIRGTENSFQSGGFDTAISTNSWYHIVVTFSAISGGTRTVKCYINGTKESTERTVNNATLTYNNTGTPTMIGSYAQDWASSWSSPWIGYIDDVAIFNDVLTATEISDLYNGNYSSIKTVNDLAKSSVKTVNGLAIASIKSINGLV